MRRAELAPESSLPAVPQATPPWPGELVRFAGAGTYVRATAALRPGLPPAVYLHGLGGSSTNWTELAGLLAGHLDAVAIDLPGTGHSDPAARYSLRAAADRVIGYLLHSGRGPVHVLGNSLGATIALKVTAARPDLVTRLTLLSPAMPFLNPCRSVQSRTVPLAVLPGGERIVRRLLARATPEQVAQQVLEACYGDPDRVDPQRLAEAVEEIRLRHTHAYYLPAYLRSLRGLVGAFLRAYLPGGGSLWRTAAAVRVPTLVIGGDRDRLVDPRVALRTARAIPDSRLLVLPGVGHVPQMEEPRLVARAVIAQLSADVPARHR